MQNNKALKLKILLKSYQNRLILKTKPRYSFDTRDKVRLIEAKHTLKKIRYNAIPFYFVISDISEKYITIAVSDGSIKTITRSRIIPIKSNE
jgi:hypothetical protein